MSAYVNLSTFAISIDAAGNSEARPLPFLFANDPVILAGDSLVSSPAPSLTQKPDNGEPDLTLGVPSRSGTTWTVEASVTGGIPGNRVLVCCLANTTQGNKLLAQVLVVLTGPG